ncbi:MAG: MFS transporter [Lachnospiraceae bacterium]|nr:MFS transporter [Lachnospiraceae bacterium]
MKKIAWLKYQYPLAQFLYWVTCCACSGFVAVYLQYKGFSNTLIGTVVGIYGVLSLILQPLTSKLIQKYSFLTVRRMLMVLLLTTGILFLMIMSGESFGMFPLVLFISINAFNSSMIPLISSFGMEYVNQKRDVNFGLARGFGSLGWAVSAAVVGFLLEKYSPDLLGYIYVVSAGILLVNIFFMEDLGYVEKPILDTEKKTDGVFFKCIRDKLFLFVALGILFDNISHAICTTYTINIVRSVGGTETAAGLAQFFGAGSEMIGMVIFAVLIRRYSSLQVLKISSIFFVVRFFFLIFAGNLPMVMIGYALQGPSAGFYIPAAVYFVNERMLPQNRTQGQAIFNVIASGMANFIGNLIGGRIIDAFGLRNMLVICFGFAVVGCVCIMSRKNSGKYNV